MARHPSRAFTLTELLVVIVLVGVVAALLVPALAGLRSRSSDLGCMVNLRQLGQLALQFSTDFDGYLPDGQVKANVASYPNLDRWPQWLRAGNPFWFTALNRYLNEGRVLDLPTGPKSIFQCPASTPAEQYVLPDTGCSYIMNAYLGSTSSGDSTTPQPRLLSIKERHRVVLYMDGYASSAYGGVYRAGTERDTVNRLRLRHGKKDSISAVFLDGHAETFKPIPGTPGFTEQIWPLEARP